MHIFDADQSPTRFVSRILRLRQSRSAESSPVMFARRFRVSGFLNCASGSHSNTSTPRMGDQDELKQQQDSSGYGSHQGLAPNTSTYADCTATPNVSSSISATLARTASNSSSSATKKQKLWRSIRRFHYFRHPKQTDSPISTKDRTTTSCSSKENQNVPQSSIGAVLQNGLSRSNPNLANSHPLPVTSTTGKSAWFGSKTPKKSIIRTPSKDLTNQNRLYTSSNCRVEFASSDEVYYPLNNDNFEESTTNRSNYDNYEMYYYPTPPYSATSTKIGNFQQRRQSTDDDLQDPAQVKTSPGSTTDGNSGGHETSYLLHVQLLEGHDLVIRDTLGSSDPYVKFNYKGKNIFKSGTIFKNLNPTWNEQFSHLIDDLSTPLQIDVYDYDRFAMDDFMGAATLDLSQFLSNQLIDVRVDLSEEKNEEYMGYLLIKLSVTAMSTEERLEFVRKAANRSTSSESTTGKKPPSKGAPHVWSSVVNIVLVEGKNLLPTDVHSHAPLPDPYVRFKLGTEKYKSKPALKTLEPKWLEQFDLHIYEEQTLDIRVLDKRKDIFMGRCTIPLGSLEREITHQNWYELEDGAGKIFLLISISGTLSSDTVADFNAAEVSAVDRRAIYERYRLLNSLENMRDVGHLTVIVFKAQGLASADIGGKSDPFCVLELVNARLQTHTEYKTLSPEWNKIFTFNVKDIHSVLELTVFDEDANNKVEFLGKVAIPLLKMKNCEKRWFALKDKKLHRRAKGQILLEFELFWNPVRASVRTVNPQEQKYMGQDPKFKRQTFMRNVMRVKNFAMSAVEVGAFVQSCWSWDSPARSLFAFVAFLVITYFFELYMIPLVLLLLFVRAYVYRLVTEGLRSKDQADEYFESDDDEDEAADEKNQQKSSTREERKSIKERLQAVQDTLATVQNVLDYIASLMERIKNTFNFTQPYLSWFAIIVLFVGTFVLYFVPLRWLIMAWGINKFTKKLRSPHAIPNNELLDFLSRVPSDDEIRRYGEFRPDPVDNVVSINNLQQAKKKRLS